MEIMLKENKYITSELRHDFIQFDFPWFKTCCWLDGDVNVIVI